ncbi:MAG: YkgJ family cysteine cluster protein [Candidatus Sericytochromatia bacterium]
MSLESNVQTNKLEPLQNPCFEQILALVETFPDHPFETLVLTTSDLARFSCSQCGVCCALPWNIHISKDYYERWYPHFHNDPSGRFQRPFQIIDAASNGHYADMRRQDNSNRCIFLEPDNRCYIHANYGEEALPDVCKRYPRVQLRHDTRYGSDYLLGSCQTAPSLLAGDLQAYYYFEPQPRHERSLPLHLPEAYYAGEMGKTQTYLWVALMLDIVQLPVNTPLQRFASLQHSLEYLCLQDQSSLTPQHLQWLYREQIRHSSELNLAAAPFNEQKRALEWFFQLLEPSFLPLLDHARKIYHGQSPWPSLDEAERECLNSFLQQFLIRKLMALPYKNPFYSFISFAQKYFLLSLHLLMIQMMAHYYRSRTQLPLNLKHLSQAVNLVEGRYSQRRDWVEQQGITQLNDEDCLSLMQTALSLNLGLMQAE